MQLLGITDLDIRWEKTYTPRGIRKFRRRYDFPQPAFFLNDGRTPVWNEADISAYETKYPELKDKEAKRRKIRAYAIGQLNKARRAAQ